MTARRIVVHGRVQGVFYRAWTVETATGLALRGWVRNRKDGTVELLAMGAEEALDALVECLHEGPPAARVDRVDMFDAEAEEADGFEKRPTL